MTPKEKARELANKFYIPIAKRNYPDVAQIQVAKECALIAVEEMIGMLKELERVQFLKPNSAISIIEEVKQEIENL